MVVGGQLLDAVNWGDHFEAAEGVEVKKALAAVLDAVIRQHHRDAESQAVVWRRGGTLSRRTGARKRGP